MAKCCMQQTCCIISMSHATLSILGSPPQLQSIKRLEEGHDALNVTKKTTKFTEPRVQV